MPTQETTPNTRASWQRWIIALTVLVNAGLTIAGSIRQRPTVDEVRQVPAGLEHWRTGTFQEVAEVPPLARLVSALPLLAWSSFESTQIRGEGPSPSAANPPVGSQLSLSDYRLARLPGFAWWVLGAWLIYRWAGELYGAKAGLLALVLWASNPNVLAREQTATPDLPCAVACPAATYAFWRWLRDPSWRWSITAGVLLGVAQLTDFAALGLPAAWLALGVAYALLYRPRADSRHPGRASSLASRVLMPARTEPRPPRADVAAHTGGKIGRREGRHRPLTRRTAQAIAGALATLFIVNAGYAFSDTGWALKDIRFVSHTLSGREVATDLDDGEAGGNPSRGSWIGNTVVPVPLDYIAGIDLRLWTSERRDRDRVGGPSRAIDRGTFEPDILFAKTPAGLLLLSTAAFTWMLLRRRGHAAVADELPVWITPAVVVELALSPAEPLFSMPVMLVLPIPFLVVGIGVLGAAINGLQPARQGEPPCEPSCDEACHEGEPGTMKTPPGTAQQTIESSALSVAPTPSPALRAPSPQRGEGWGEGAAHPAQRRGSHQWRYTLPVAALTLWTVASGLAGASHPLAYVNEVVRLWPNIAPAAQQPGPGDKTDALPVLTESVVLPADRPGALQGRRARSLRGIATESDLVALKGWLDKHPEAKPLGLACLGPINPRRLGIDFRLPPHDPGPKLADAPWYTPRTGPYPGYFALDQQSLSLDRYRYFNQFKPIIRVGDSIAVYHVTLQQAEQARETMGRKPLETIVRPSPSPAEHGLLERVYEYPDGRSYNYAVFIPDDYAGDKPYPVILFLHGRGEIAAHAYLQVTLPATIKEQKHTFSFIAVIPQGRAGNWGAGDADSKAAMDILARVENQYRVDSARIYLTGVSSGGWGVWELAATYPHQWAAIVPLASPGNSALAQQIAGIPCWCFHNSFDSQRSVVDVRYMIAALRKAGGTPRYTEFQDLTADLSRGLFMARHNCWDRAYNMPELYDWMIQQSRPNLTAAAAMNPHGKQ